VIRSHRLTCPLVSRKPSFVLKGKENHVQDDHGGKEQDTEVLDAVFREDVSSDSPERYGVGGPAESDIAVVKRVDEDMQPDAEDAGEDCFDEAGLVREAEQLHPPAEQGSHWLGEEAAENPERSSAE